MPTRTSQKNPKGLSRVAKLALEVQPKVSSILERLSKDEEFAAQIDDAVMQGDKATIEKKMQEVVPRARLVIERVESDRAMIFCWYEYIKGTDKGERSKIICVRLDW